MSWKKCGEKFDGVVIEFTSEEGGIYRSGCINDNLLCCFLGFYSFSRQFATSC